MTLTGLPIFIEEFLFTAVIVFITTLAYRFLINQSELKQLKDSLKEKQARMKEVQKTSPEEAKKVMAETLSLSNKQLRMTMKPMMVSLIIFFVALPFFGEAYGDKTINLNSNISNFTLDGANYNLQLNQGSISIDSLQCNIPCDKQAIGNYKWNINMDNNSTVRMSRVVALLPFSLPYFGSDFGWLAWYIITSFALNFVFRKILGVEI